MKTSISISTYDFCDEPTIIASSICSAEAFLNNSTYPTVIAALGGARVWNIELNTCDTLSIENAEALAKAIRAVTKQVKKIKKELK